MSIIAAPDDARATAGVRTLMRHTVSLAGRPSPAPPAGVTFGLGVLPQFARDPLDMLLRAGRDHGDVVYLQMGPRRRHVPAFLVTHPAGVRRVLASGAKTYRKSFTNLPARSIFGLGLLTSDGASWAGQRQLVRPLFQRDRFAAVEIATAAAGADLVRRWDDFARTGEVIDVGAEMARASLAVLLDSMFGVPMSDQDAVQVRAAFSVLSQESWRRTTSPLWWMSPATARVSPRSQRFRRAGAQLDAMIRRLLARQHPDDQVSLLSLLAKARDEQGAPLPWSLIRDEVATFLVAGHETTAAALTWAWYLLAGHPERYEPFVDPSEPEPAGPTHRYADAVVREALRLYPPAWSIVRDTVADDTIGDCDIPAGSVVITSPYVTQRLSSVWPDPETFDPGRFLDPAPEADAGAYFPFGDGMRRCVGERLALQQATQLMSILAGRFSLRVAPGAAPVRARAAITLRPDGPMLMTVHRRDGV